MTVEETDRIHAWLDSYEEAMQEAREKLERAGR
jgi:hypothetical protein